MGNRRETVRRTWGEIEFRSAEEEIGERSEWNVRSDRHTLKVLRSGEVHNYRASVEGRPWASPSLGPGSVSLVPAGSVYRSRGRGGWIAFSVLSFPAPGTATPFLDGRDAFVTHTVARLDEALTQGEERLGETLAQALFLHLQSRYVAPVPCPLELDARQRRSLETYLDAHLHARPTVDDLAHAVGMGRDRFLAAFRHSFGTTPARYARELRLDRARRRLEASAPDLTELALDLGFASHSHLTAAFRARYGIPPREYRREFRADRRPSPGT
jgi:AraC family transcriptional regulator